MVGCQLSRSRTLPVSTLLLGFLALGTPLFFFLILFTPMSASGSPVAYASEGLVYSSDADGGAARKDRSALQCEACQAVIRELVNKVHALPVNYIIDTVTGKRKKGRPDAVAVLEAVEQICQPASFSVYEFPPPQMIKQCNTFLAANEDELEALLTAPGPDTIDELSLRNKLCGRKAVCPRGLWEITNKEKEEREAAANKARVERAAAEKAAKVSTASDESINEAEDAPAPPPIPVTPAPKPASTSTSTSTKPVNKKSSKKKPPPEAAAPKPATPTATSTNKPSEATPPASSASTSDTLAAAGNSDAGHKKKEKPASTKKPTNRAPNPSNEKATDKKPKSDAKKSPSASTKPQKEEL